MRRFSTTLLSVFLVPFGDPKAWHQEKYSQIPANEVQFSQSALRIRVKNSSSPLLFRLPDGLQVGRLKVSAKADGLPKLSSERPEGEGENDDYVLRVGLVQPGDYRPSWVERLFAPRWLLNLLDLAGDQYGLDKVHFFDVTQKTDPSAPVQTRDRFYDSRSVKKVQRAGDISFETELSSPMPSFALWLHSDGDNSRSEFTVQINEISLRR